MTKKTIGFLATGNEIVNGDIADTVSVNFAKALIELGAELSQRVHTSDHQDDIKNALLYLLTISDAVIVIGGLGPTSDDKTRFAIAECINQELVFDSNTWQYVKARLAAVDVEPVKANRQQALFPENSTIISNENGSACGCYLWFNHKLIIMLPGPPRENQPMFFNSVIPLLTQENFFRKKIAKRWLTLGLIEGEISTTIDEIVKSTSLQTGFRWNYPYLEIKIMGDDEGKYDEIFQEVENLLSPYTVSREIKDAMILLYELLATINFSIHVIDNTEIGNLHKEFPRHPCLHFLKKTSGISSKTILLCISVSGLLTKAGQIVFTAKGYINGKCQFDHSISTPNRGMEIIEFAKAYIAWKLKEIIQWQLNHVP